MTTNKKNMKLKREREEGKQKDQVQLLIVKGKSVVNLG